MWLFGWPSSAMTQAAGTRRVTGRRVRLLDHWSIRLSGCHHGFPCGWYFTYKDFGARSIGETTTLNERKRIQRPVGGTFVTGDAHYELDHLTQPYWGSKSESCFKSFVPGVGDDITSSAVHRRRPCGGRPSAGPARLACQAHQAQQAMPPLTRGGPPAAPLGAQPKFASS